MVMIEAMACGTPVIAYPRGSIPELVEDGVSGFIVGNVSHAVRTVSEAAALSRLQCRDYFERRFSAARMCEDYSEVYKSLFELNRESVKSVAFPGILTLPPSRIPPITVSPSVRSHSNSGKALDGNGKRRVRNRVQLQAAQKGKTDNSRLLRPVANAPTGGTDSSPALDQAEVGGDQVQTSGWT
jgi:hypothetical protein